MEWCATSAERTSQANQRSGMFAAAITASPARPACAWPTRSEHHRGGWGPLPPRPFLVIAVIVAPFCQLRNSTLTDGVRVASNAPLRCPTPRPAREYWKPRTVPSRRALIVPRRSTRPRLYAAFVAKVCFPFPALFLLQDSPQTHLRTGLVRRPGRTYRATVMQCSSHSSCPVPASSPR